MYHQPMVCLPESPAYIIYGQINTYLPKTVGKNDYIILQTTVQSRSPENA